MPCLVVRDEKGQFVAAICSSGRRSKARCFYCNSAVVVAQCDFPIVRKPTGRLKTCDRYLCIEHRKPGVSKNVDFCEEHYPLAKAASERREYLKEQIDSISAESVLVEQPALFK